MSRLTPPPKRIIPAREQRWVATVIILFVVMLYYW